MWDAEANALKQQFRVIRLDTRGHGSSSVPSGDYTLERLGRDVLVALDMVGVAQAHVCGLSMGGMVAQWLAVHTPARVDRLILADTAARIGTPESWQARRETVRAQGMAAIAEMAIGRFFSEEFRARAPDTVARFRRLLETTSPEGYAGCCAALRDADFSCELARIVAPTLVICGRLDISTPPSQAEALVQDIPEAELLLLDAAHLSNIERPVAFLEGMHRHLGS
jgi:3-oxoadipate enol-lactonase